MCIERKDPLVIIPQIMSIVAFFLSFGWIWPFVVGFCLMIVQQILWCWKGAVHNFVFLLLAATSIAAVGLNFYAANAMTNTTNVGACFPIFTIEYMCNDMRTFVGSCHYASGGLWLLSAILDVTVVVRNIQNDNGNSGDDEEAVAIPDSEGQSSEV